MTESREQFRQRLNKQYWATYYDTMHKTGHLGSTRAEEYAAEAVYAAALRDVLALGVEVTSRDAFGEPYDPEQIIYPDAIREYAASLGIDLEDAP